MIYNFPFDHSSKMMKRKNDGTATGGRALPREARVFCRNGMQTKGRSNDDDDFLFFRSILRALKIE